MAVSARQQSLEDHAARACLRRMDIQEEANELAVGTPRPGRIDSGGVSG